MVARQATEQIMDLRYTLRMMGIPIDGPAWMFGDNASVITSSNIPHSNLNKRHNALSYHRVREAIAAEIMYFLHMDGKYNPSDILTKFLNWAKFWPLVQPMLFWKGETTRKQNQNSTLTQEIQELKNAALPSGLRGVTSIDSDVTTHAPFIVKPSGNASITSCTLAVSSHPKMSLIGQELSSGEQLQCSEQSTVPPVDIVCPHAPHEPVPPGTNISHGTITPIRSVVPGVASLSTASTKATVTVQDSHTMHQLSRISTGAADSVLSTENDPVSKWILVQPRHKAKI
jgi:hypothetical protein